MQFVCRGSCGAVVLRQVSAPLAWDSVTPLVPFLAPVELRLPRARPCPVPVMLKRNGNSTAAPQKNPYSFFFFHNNYTYNKEAVGFGATSPFLEMCAPLWGRRPLAPFALRNAATEL